jgi:hypothetical protein
MDGRAGAGLGAARLQKERSCRPEARQLLDDRPRLRLLGFLMALGLVVWREPRVRRAIDRSEVGRLQYGTLRTILYSRSGVGTVLRLQCDTTVASDSVA